MTVRIVRVGGVLTVEIPEAIAAQSSLPVGEPLEWITNEDGSIALVPADERDCQKIQAGLAELDAGHAVSNQRVSEWLESWGTESELPTPR